MKKNKKPYITVKAALVPYDGNQSELARALGVHRSYVGKWNKRNKKDLPELYAWRFAVIHPELITWKKR